MPLLHHAGALGDFVLSLPFLRGLCRDFPRATWTLACPEEHAALVARVFPHERRVAPGAAELAPLAAPAFDPGRIAALLDRHGGLCGFLPRAADLEALARALRPELPVRLTEPLACAAAAGRPIEEIVGPGSFAIGRDELPPLEFGIDPLAFLGSRPRDRVAWIHPGASSPAKAAPRERLAALARVLEARGFTVGWIRGPVEAERGDDRPPEPCLDRPSLVLLAHTIACAHLYVGNDSGPTHLAAALGVPTVAVHVVPNPAWRPRGERVVVVEGERGLDALPLDAVPGT
ncbi:MAG: glycosyltransferase family 9 protein [Planctomycetes bacterium]|nr:glycosyltransferase family 9 protein [Planctomycetota bacterium]